MNKIIVFGNVLIGINVYAADNNERDNTIQLLKRMGITDEEISRYPEEILVKLDNADDVSIDIRYYQVPSNSLKKPIEISEEKVTESINVIENSNKISNSKITARSSSTVISNDGYMRQILILFSKLIRSISCIIRE